MEQLLNNLVYDRTQADVYNQTLKGRCKKEDLTRIEEWTQFLVELLAEYGYQAAYAPPKDGCGMVHFPYSGQVEHYIIPEDGTYTFVLYGAGGSHGSRWSVFDANVGGKGAKMVYTTFFPAGTKLQILTGGRGLLFDNPKYSPCVDENGVVVRFTSYNGSGGGGGMSAVFREIPEITDDLYQFEKDGVCLEAMAVAAGGSGGIDYAYYSTSPDYHPYKENPPPGRKGFGRSYYYPGIHEKKYTTYDQAAYDPDISSIYNDPNAVLGIMQFVKYGGRGTHYANSAISQGGFGCGSGGMTGGGFGGGWRSAAGNGVLSWCRDNTAVGYDGVRAGDGLVTIRNNDLWKREDFPTQSEMDRIRTNIQSLKEGFFAVPTWKDFVTTAPFMDISQANAMEWDLEQIYIWLQSVVKGFHLRRANSIFMEAGGVLNR